MFSKHFQKDKHFSKTGFRHRGLESSHLENLTDAVFAFVITLLVIASEVPKTYTELQASIYGFIGFIACILLLFGLWNNHSSFFLRYGLQDNKTRTLNFLFLFVLLFYIYPLKYLFSYLGSVLLINVLGSTNHNTEAFQMAYQKVVASELNVNQWKDLMVRFGLGMFLIYSIFSLMDVNAMKKKKELELNSKELFETKTFLYSYMALSLISLFSMFFVLIFGGVYAGYAGCFYMLIPLVLPLLKLYRVKKMNLIFAVNSEEEEFLSKLKE